MKTNANILIVDDDRDVLETARMFLKQEFSSVDIEENPEKIFGYFEIKDYDVILLDMNFNKGVNDGAEGFHWLKKILEFDSDAIVILITAYGEVDLAVEAMKQGASDFVLKPWKNQKLLGTVLSALKHRNAKKEIGRNRAIHEQESSEYRTGKLIGSSSAMKHVRELIKKVAQTDANVLILGENGTGKDLVARAVHAESLRRNAAFVPVDVGSLTDTLFESELFGHVKGAFTDARTDRKGRVEQAHEGTLFLDEIGNLSPKQQSKLLTMLQARTIQPVGSNKVVNVDFRLLSATNGNLKEMVKSDQFRQDLLYRMNTVEIPLPPLRERKEDIQELLDHFLSLYKKKYQKPKLKLSTDAEKRIEGYNWPGNVRELQHAVERAVILTDGDTIHAEDVLPFHNEHADNVFDTDKTLDEMEKAFIIQSLKSHGGNVSKTAKALGLTRTAMYRRLNKFDITGY